MTYYEYFYKARQDHIEQYLSIIARIDVLEPEISNTARQLEAAQQTLDRQEQKLVAGKRQRQRNLDRLM